MEKRFYAPRPEQTHEIGDHELPPAPKKLLILDDDEDFLGILRDYLEAEGFQVATATSGVDGIKRVMAEMFDVVLCDMIMPSMPGDMFYKAVERTKPDLCKRFVFMTGNQADPKVAEFIRGIRGLMLWKPFEMHQLMEAIHGVLAKAAKS